MAIRTMPFGYFVTGGKTAILDEEKEIVLRIFNMYIDGKSYLTIAKILTEEKVKYAPLKEVWNKNMVARILQNRKYLGEDELPKIVEDTLFETVQNKIKPYNLTVSDDIKTLKPMLICSCGNPLKRRANSDGNGRWSCCGDKTHIGVNLTDEMILNGVEILQKNLSENSFNTAKSERTSAEKLRLENMLRHEFSFDEIDSEKIENLLVELATENYRLCEDTYFSEKEIVKSLKNSDSLNAKLLAKITDKIIIENDRVTKIVLKGENYEC